MYAQAYDGSNKGITFHGMDNHPVKTIVIEYAVVDPFGAGSCFIYVFIFVSSASDGSIQPDIPVGLCIYDAPIRRGRTGIRAGITFAHYTGASPFNTVPGRIVTIEDHPMPIPAQRRAIFVDCKLGRQGFRSPSPVV